MALKDDILALPSTVGEGNAGHLGNHATIHAGLKDHETRITTAEANKADKTTLDTRVPSNTALRLDTTVGTRVFAGTTMIHGSTGYRAITPEISWDTSAAATRMVISRDNNLVELEARIVPGSNLIGKPRGDQLAALTLPAGFRPRVLHGSSYPSGTAYVMSDAIIGALGTLLIVNRNSLELRMSAATTGTWAATDIILLHASWRTDEAWPTTLPGLPS